MGLCFKSQMQILIYLQCIPQEFELQKQNKDFRTMLHTNIQKGKLGATFACRKNKDFTHTLWY
jgi:hypothetical protein